jgi:AcrR family transcriptional regulator
MSRRRSETVAFAEARRAAILAAAGEAFLSKGYAATTTLEIARRAHTSKRALYQHFADKRDILDEIVRDRSGEMIAPIAMAAPESPAEFFATIEAFGATLLARLVDPTTIALYRLAISESGPTNDLGQALEANGRARVFKRMRGYIGEGASRGWIEAPDLDALTEAYFDLLIGALTMERLLGDGPRRTSRRFAAAPSARRER